VTSRHRQLYGTICDWQQHQVQPATGNRYHQWQRRAVTNKLNNHYRNNCKNYQQRQQPAAMNDSNQLAIMIHSDQLQQPCSSNRQQQQPAATGNSDKQQQQLVKETVNGVSDNFQAPAATNSNRYQTPQYLWQPPLIANCNNSDHQQRSAVIDDMRQQQLPPLTGRKSKRRQWSAIATNRNLRQWPEAATTNNE